MTAEYTEHPESGYFNCWSGRHPTACVRTLDLYMAWGDGEVFPPLAAFENLRSLVLPGEMLTPARVAEVSRTPVFAGGSRLEQLDLSANPLAALDVDVLPRGLTVLKVLADLEAVGDGLAELVHLRVLALGSKLRALVLSANRLTVIPEAVRALPWLTELKAEWQRP